MNNSRDYQVGLSFSVLHRAAFTYFQEKLKPWGLGPGQQAYLLALIPGQDTKQEELARRLGVNKANVSRGVQSLEASGLVQRHSSSGSKRSFSLQLTPKGHHVQQAVVEVSQNWIRELKQPLSEDEWVTLSHLLTKLTGPFLDQPNLPT